MQIRYITPLLFSVSVISHSYVLAQDAKTLRKYGFTSIVTESQEDGKTYIEKTETLNSNGDPLEIIEYDPSGIVKKKWIYKYDQSGNMLSESEYKGEVLKIKIEREYTGKKNQKSMEKETDGSGKIISWKKFYYDSLGDKTEEHLLDHQGNTIQIHRYAYNKFGMKSTRKTYDISGNLIQEKNYRYK